MSSFDELKSLCLANQFDWKFSKPGIFFRNFMFMPGDDAYAVALKHCVAEEDSESVVLGNGGLYEMPSRDFGLVEIKIDRGADARLVSRAGGNNSCGFFFIVIDDGASVVYNHNINNEMGSTVFESIGFFLGEGSRLYLTKEVAGNLNFRSELSFFMVGENAKVDGKISYAGNGGFFDCRVLQYHLKPNTLSNLIVKFAPKGNVNSSFHGKIMATDKARDSEAKQLHRSLILSDSAGITSVPSMEVKNNSIKCYHGATVGEINSEQLFYLGTRGIDRSTAEQMIVDGFLKFY
ncbi:MAG: SufD family Fe-S cluster assembly protein [Puniceicoccales bacterium]|jgi:Fe-S cluster assembly scaffold protein SufB|nr:SufD family Fe-S cluster assembly protein [Puniceicoccales bacterium]